MQIHYMASAIADLRRIVRFGIENDLPDPANFVRGLRNRFARLAEIAHPGRKGRLDNTREWVVTGTPYIAVFRRVDEAVTIVRVLHGVQQWPAWAHG